MKLQRYSVQVIDTWGFSEYWVVAVNPEAAGQFIRKAYREILSLKVMATDDPQNKEKLLMPPEALPEAMPTVRNSAEFLTYEGDDRTTAHNIAESVEARLTSSVILIPERIVHGHPSFIVDPETGEVRKRGPGRPKGSRNKRRANAIPALDMPERQKHGPGRPPGSKNKKRPKPPTPPATAMTKEEGKEPTGPVMERKRGTIVVPQVIGGRAKVSPPSSRYD